MTPIDFTESGMFAGEPDCLGWEALMSDLAEGQISAADEAALRAHALECPTCAQLLEQVIRGRDWARLLHDTPPPVPEELLARILEKTSGVSAPPRSGILPGLAMPPEAMAMPSGAVIAAAARSQQQARILMTAAMAIFSIAITLSMTMQRFGTVNPSSVAATASHQFFHTEKHVVRFYDNMRLIREVEATWQDLHNSSGSDAPKKSGTHGVGPSAFHLQQASPAANLLASLTVAEERTQS